MFYSLNRVLFVCIFATAIACEENNEKQSQCDPSHFRVGMSVDFEHDGQHTIVPTGTVFISDNCQIEVQNFNWDALGDDTYVWAGFYDDIENGFPVSETINGDEPFENASLQYELPEGKTLDDFDCIAIYEASFNEMMAFARFVE